MQKAQGDIQQALGSANSIGPATGRENDIGTAIIHEDGTVVRPSMDDKASTRALRSPTSTSKADEASENGEFSMIPSIRISTESSRAKDGESEVTKVEEEEEKPDSAKKKGKAKATEDEDDDDDEDDDEDQDEVVEKKAANGNTQTNGVKTHAPEKPAQAAGEGEQAMNEASPSPTQEPFSFSTKRLCERWLDNLFMVLYEACHFSIYSHNVCDIDILCFSTSRIYASGRFSALRLPISKLSMSPTAKQG